MSIKPRIPYFCKGCPHERTYEALVEVLKLYPNTIINGDIGCYEIAGFGNVSGKNEPDYKKLRDLIDTLFVMGSGISVSQGMYKSGYKGKIVALAGDSTFFHACMPGIVNAVVNKSEITFLIFDNRCTAMTGHQENAGNFINIKKVVE